LQHTAQDQVIVPTYFLFLSLVIDNSTILWPQFGDY